MLGMVCLIFPFQVLYLDGVLTFAGMSLLESLSSLKLADLSLRRIHQRTPIQHRLEMCDWGVDYT